MFSSSGVAADMVAKYRPPCPVIVISRTEHVLRRCCARFGLYPCTLPENITDLKPAIQAGLEYAS